MDLENTKKLALSIKEQIDSATLEEKEQILNDLYSKWVIKPNPQNNMFDYLRLAIFNFGFTDIDNLQIGTFDKACKVVFFQLNNLQLHFMDNEKNEYASDTEEKFSKIFKAVTDAENAVMFALYLKSSMTQEEIGKEKKITKQDLFRYNEIDYKSLTPYQILLMYLYSQLRLRDYRRYIVDGKGMCYKKIYTEEGYDTHAWKEAMSITDFVLSVTTINYNYKMWENRTSQKNNIDAAVHELSTCLEKEVNDLVRDRHVFSFKNGIYITKIPDEKDLWIPYTGNKTKKIGSSIVSCKLFDLEFEEIITEPDNWFDIIKNNCKNLIQIMNYQQWPEEAQKWFCILIGRLLYDIKELGEDWQVLPYLLGQAGSGKSTILDSIVYQLYDKPDIGVLGNNIEKKFGLSALVGKKIFIGPEIKENLELDQAEFQSMISGEMVQVNTKYKQAYSKRFTAPGILAGNELPGYVDNAGSLSRRFVVFPFNFKVKKQDSDTKLSEKLKKEMGYILQGCNKGYLWALDKYGTRGIWDILPNFFKDTKDQMAQDSNALLSFLNSERVILNKDAYCREKIFISAFNDFCRDKCTGTHKWTSQYYLGPFADCGVSMGKNIRKKYPNNEFGKFYTGTFVLGVDIKEPVQKSDDLSEE